MDFHLKGGPLGFYSGQCQTAYEQGNTSPENMKGRVDP